MADLIRHHESGGLCTLTLNRPEKRNALNAELFIELDEHLARLETRTDRIGCVVLRGAGPSFCAGADLGGIRSGAAMAATVNKPQVIERLQRLPQPVIAAVHGHCYTGGLELALAADFIISAQSGRFADTHGKWGLVAGWGLTQRLPRRIGLPQAKRMMMTAGTITAEQAAAIGLVDLCVADDAFEAALHEFVAAILSNSWHSNRESKRLMLETDGMSLREGLAYEIRNHPGPAPDHQERLARFPAADKA